MAQDGKEGRNAYQLLVQSHYFSRMLAWLSTPPTPSTQTTPLHPSTLTTPPATHPPKCIT
ncbi:hypothetical protein E2C01_031775 [Portunus trituberculatus]|uniref:Uncharacterized protein n=1 Tax=Portunus trituberculatus TaxID=210409 RepID=A0A5B7EZ27_PORTR|nr:hypothetical protein [Portunus trituberculatus]